MGIKTITIFEDIPIIEGKTYQTKFQTKDMFTVTKITLDKNGKQIKVEGIYERAKHLGICPLNIDRLVLDQIQVGEKKVCDCCLTQID